MSGNEVDLSAVNAVETESGVALGGELLAFTDAVMQRDPEAILRTRSSLGEKLGSQGVVEAAAVIMMFNVVDRVADATGIPIDDGMMRDVRYQIGGELGMQHLTPEARAAR